jgi:hypothetical protein
MWALICFRISYWTYKQGQRYEMMWLQYTENKKEGCGQFEGETKLKLELALFMRSRRDSGRRVCAG